MSFSKNSVFRQRPLFTRPLCQSRAELQSELDSKDHLFPPSIKSTASKLNAALGNGPIVSGSENEDGGLVGEDASVFNVEDQQTLSWIYFTLVLGVVLAIPYVIWLDPNTTYGGAFTNALTKLNNNHEVVMMEILLIFALVHSGGAGFRAIGERLIGKRAYRVLFAGISLPLAPALLLCTKVFLIHLRYHVTNVKKALDPQLPGSFCAI